MVQNSILGDYMGAIYSSSPIWSKKYCFALYITLFVECTLNVNMGIDKLLNTVLNISQPQLTLLYSSLIE
jgi:hypothetical protein